MMLSEYQLYQERHSYLHYTDCLRGIHYTRKNPGQFSTEYNFYIYDSNV